MYKERNEASINVDIMYMVQTSPGKKVFQNCSTCLYKDELVVIDVLFLCCLGRCLLPKLCR